MSREKIGGPGTTDRENTCMSWAFPQQVASGFPVIDASVEFRAQRGFGLPLSSQTDGRHWIAGYRPAPTPPDRRDGICPKANVVRMEKDGKPPCRRSAGMAVRQEYAPCYRCTLSGVRATLDKVTRCGCCSRSNPFEKVSPARKGRSNPCEERRWDFYQERLWR